MNDLHRAAATAVLAAAGPWGGHSNGNIPLSALTTLSWATGHRLRSDAAAAFESLNQAYRARFGTSISITDSYRTLAAQQHLYETKGPGLAAVPGTSNHGWALAVDLGGGINSFGTAQHVWMVANGPAYGWIHPTWARQGGGREEAWHFEYEGTTTTPPTSEEDDMTPEQDTRLKAVENKIAGLAARQEIIFFESKGTVYEASLLSGTYRALPTSATLTDRRAVLGAAGIPFRNWADSVGNREVENPGAFGIRVG